MRGSASTHIRRVTRSSESFQMLSSRLWISHRLPSALRLAGISGCPLMLLRKTFGCDGALREYARTSLRPFTATKARVPYVSKPTTSAHLTLPPNLTELHSFDEWS